MYITNRPDVAVIAEQAGVDRIFIDMEYIGKEKRQCGMDTVKSHHTVEDIRNIRKVISHAQILVRCNALYDGSADEIEAIIEAGADIIMLPYFKTMDEIEEFLDIVRGRTKVCLLLETVEAAQLIDEILLLDGIDEIHIGINDLSLEQEKKFLFEVLADGTVDELGRKIAAKGIPFGFGGIASLKKGQLPSDMIIMDHYRLGSSMAILSRSFCNTEDMQDIDEIERVFRRGILEIRSFEQFCVAHPELWESNHQRVIREVNSIVAGYIR